MGAKPNPRIQLVGHYCYAFVEFEFGELDVQVILPQLNGNDEYMVSERLAL